MIIRIIVFVVDFPIQIGNKDVVTSMSVCQVGWGPLWCVNFILN